MQDIICDQGKRLNFACFQYPPPHHSISLFLITTDGSEVAARAYFIKRE